jgi:membrane-bound lytic murein transglycosylase F
MRQAIPMRARQSLPVAGLLCLSCTPVARESADRYAAKGDLGALRERGELRVLVPTVRDQGLARQGTPDAEDREMALSFARRIGVRASFIEVGSRSELLDLLSGGYGDVVMAQLTVTPERAKELRFTQPTASVDEWLVGRRGDPDSPRSPAELEGREVHVRRSSAFVDTLRALADAEGLSLRMVFVDEAVDTETIAYEVSRGKRPLTVVDSNLLSAIETYNDALERLFVLAEGRELAWVVRKDSEELGSALDAFIIEHVLTSHLREDVTTSGLEAIRSRGSLRVITRNDPVHYFLYRGRQMGFDYEIGKLLASRLGVRLEMVVPPSRDLAFDWLLEGRGDIVAGTLLVDPEREGVVAFSQPYLFVEEVLVQASGTSAGIERIEDLRNESVHVFRSSGHYPALARLSAELGPIRIESIPEDLDVAGVLDRIASGEYGFAVVDSLNLSAELSHRDDVRAALTISPPGTSSPVAFALRSGNPDLRAEVDDFVSELVGSLALNDARLRYFRENRGLKRVKERRAAVTGRLSPYDDLFKKYAQQYALDWRLLVAQAYQESRFDPDAESWAGARGLFQVLPATGLELGFEDLTDPETGIHAGAKQMHLLLERLEPGVPLQHRVRLALAAYNAGWGHLTDARRLASEQGLDPDRWFGHTEKAMLLLSEPRFYQHARHGYVRGRETVDYVSEIQNRYDHYVTLVSF